MSAWYWVVGILGLALLMVVHEGGHFLAARAYGMRVTKFSIGFGPAFFRIAPKDGYFWFTTAADKVRLRLWRHDPERHGPTVYQVAMIPILAYVQIAGMNPLEEVDPNDKGSYANASLLGRIVAIFAGPAANYLFASVFFFASLMIGGREVLLTVVNVIPGSAAAAANMQDGDKIVQVDGIPVDAWGPMAEIISRNPNKTIPIVVERDGQRLTLDVTPKDVEGKGRIGVGSRTQRAPVGAKEAAILSLQMPPTVVKNTVIQLGQLLTGKAQGELGGPKRIAEEMAKAAKQGAHVFLELLGGISAYLGAFNLLPFPALDGGRLMFLLYEATTRRRPNARIEVGVHTVGFFMLISLVLYVTVFNDFGVGSK